MEGEASAPRELVVIAGKSCLRSTGQQRAAVPTYVVVTRRWSGRKKADKSVRLTQEFLFSSSVRVAESGVRELLTKRH